MARKLWAKHFLRAELLAILILCSLFYVIMRYADWGLRELVLGVVETDGSLIYGTLASLFGALLGFSLTVIAIVSGFSQSEKFAVVRESQQYKTLWRVLKEAVRWLGLATIAALVGLVFPTLSDDALLFPIIVLFVVLMAMARVARMIWVLEKTIDIIIKAR